MFKFMAAELTGKNLSTIVSLQKAGRTFMALFSILPVIIAPILAVLFTTTVADAPSEDISAHFKRNVMHLPTSCPEAVSMVPTLLASATACREHDQNLLGLSRRHIAFDHSSQSLPGTLTERSQIPYVLAVGHLIWEQMNVVFNASSVASYVNTQFYTNITAIFANRDKWIGPAANIFILSCGAIKLIFEIVAAERPVAWQTVHAFLLEFARLMIHITRSLTLVSYRAVALTALATYLITLKVMENASQRDLVTGPAV